jgi:hypothetical protein
VTRVKKIVKTIERKYEYFDTVSRRVRVLLWKITPPSPPDVSAEVGYLAFPCVDEAGHTQNQRQALK